jgi:hypothetical protein
LYSGCLPLNDADLLNIDDGTMNHIADWILNQQIESQNGALVNAFDCWINLGGDNAGGCTAGSNDIETMKQVSGPTRSGS